VKANVTAQKQRQWFHCPQHYRIEVRLLPIGCQFLTPDCKRNPGHARQPTAKPKFRESFSTYLARTQQRSDKRFK